MIVGVCRETFPHERRVALIPDVVAALSKQDLDVRVEQDAGREAGITDAAFQEKGAKIAGDRAEVFAKADLVLQVRSLGANPEAGRPDLDLMRAGQAVIGFAEPLSTPNWPKR